MASRRAAALSSNATSCSSTVGRTPVVVAIERGPAPDVTAPPDHGRSAGPSHARHPHLPSLPANAVCPGIRPRGRPRRRREAGGRAGRYPPGGGPDGLRWATTGRSRVRKPTPDARPAARRASGGAPQPAPVQIRWYRTRVEPKEEGGGRLNSWTPVVALSRACRRRADDRQRGAPRTAGPRGRRGRGSPGAFGCGWPMEGSHRARRRVSAWRSHRRTVPVPGLRPEPRAAGEAGPSAAVEGRMPAADLALGADEWRRAWILVTEGS